MDRILALKKTHKEIENYLLFFEEGLEENLLDPQLVKNTFKNILYLFKGCKEREKTLFEDIGESNPLMEDKVLKRLRFLNMSINGHARALRYAFDSRNIALVRLSLENDGRMFISDLKKKIYLEEMIFDRLLFLNMAKMYSQDKRITLQ